MPGIMDMENAFLYEALFESRLPYKMNPYDQWLYSCVFEYAVTPGNLPFEQAVMFDSLFGFRRESTHCATQILPLFPQFANELPAFRRLYLLIKTKI